MNNEEKILEILLQMQQEQQQTNQRLARLESDVTGLRDDVDEIKVNVKYIWEDVDRNASRISVQEDIIKKKIM